MTNRPPFLRTHSAPTHAGKPAWLRWYATQRWRRRARAQLDAEPRCVHCLPKVVEAKIADHVEHHGGDPVRFWTGALQSLCWSCHSVKSLTDRTGRSRQIKGCDAAGIPKDPSHHWHAERAG